VGKKRTKEILDFSRTRPSDRNLPFFQISGNHFMWEKDNKFHASTAEQIFKQGEALFRDLKTSQREKKKARIGQ